MERQGTHTDNDTAIQCEEESTPQHNNGAKKHRTRRARKKTVPASIESAGVIPSTQRGTHTQPGDDAETGMILLESTAWHGVDPAAVQGWDERPRHSRAATAESPAAESL